MMGVSPLFIRQRLKLANVAPRFIKAYRAEEIRGDQLERWKCCNFAVTPW
jgi:hypothetical protein